MTPLSLARAGGLMVLPLTEVWKTVGGTGLGDGM